TNLPGHCRSHSRTAHASSWQRRAQHAAAASNEIECESVDRTVRGVLVRVHCACADGEDPEECGDHDDGEGDIAEDQTSQSLTLTNADRLEPVDAEVTEDDGEHCGHERGERGSDAEDRDDRPHANDDR